MKNSIKISLYAVLFSMCVFAFTTDGYSQEQETSEEVDLTPKFGIKGGVNLSNLYVDNVQDEHVKVAGLRQFRLLVLFFLPRHLRFLLEFNHILHRDRHDTLLGTDF